MWGPYLLMGPQSLFGWPNCGPQLLFRLLDQGFLSEAPLPPSGAEGVVPSVEGSPPSGG